MPLQGGLAPRCLVQIELPTDPGRTRAPQARATPRLPRHLPFGPLLDDISWDGAAAGWLMSCNGIDNAQARDCKDTKS